MEPDALPEPRVTSLKHLNMQGNHIAFFTTSWDDGHPLDLRISELLSKYGLKGTFYIPLDGMFRRLSDDGIRQVASSFEVGAHTVQHRDLSRLSDQAAREEISDCKRQLEDLLGSPCRMFCFPRGRYRSQQLHMIKETGYVGARTGEWLSTRFPRMENGVLLMSTTINAGNHSPAQCAINLMKHKAVRNLPNYSRLCFGSRWFRGFERTMETVLRRGGVFHVWGHSWEIEELQLWGELEESFRLMSLHRNSARFATNGEICDYALGLPVSKNQNATAT